jgi:hypothetical protein
MTHGESDDTNRKYGFFIKKCNEKKSPIILDKSILTCLLWLGGQF